MSLADDGRFTVTTFTTALRDLVAVARLRLTGDFLVAVLTVAVDAGIWMLAFVTLIL